MGAGGALARTRVGPGSGRILVPMTTWSALVAVPIVPRFAIVGSTLAGVIGCVVGLIVGLRVYAPTAWFATLELGVPSAVAGAVLGLILGSMAALVRMVVRH